MIKGGQACLRAINWVSDLLLVAMINMIKAPESDELNKGIVSFLKREGPPW